MDAPFLDGPAEASAEEIQRWLNGDDDDAQPDEEVDAGKGDAGITKFPRDHFARP